MTTTVGESRALSDDGGTPISRPYRRPATPELIIPNAPWETVRARVHKLWVAQDAPHHSLLGQTRSGKTYLIVNGLLPMCKWDRVLIIDVKGDDPSLPIGRKVTRMPGRFRAVADMIREKKPMQNWFRLIVDRNYEIAHEQVGEALEEIFEMGDFVVVVDELRAILDTRPPGINLAPIWETLMMRGGYKGISMINATQEPRWVKGSFYTQASFFWLSRVEDERAQQRIAEIGSSRALLPHLGQIEKRRWLYMDNEEPQRFWARTKVT